MLYERQRATFTSFPPEFKQSLLKEQEKNNDK